MRVGMVFAIRFRERFNSEDAKHKLKFYFSEK